MADFFGCAEPRIPKMIDLVLPKHPGRSLPLSKLTSLAKKYFTIPVKYRSFYPEVILKEAKKLASSENSKPRKRKNKASNESERKVKRKVGRPKTLPPIGKGIVSVASYFRTTNKD